jgi:hypothetical protein
VGNTIAIVLTSFSPDVEQLLVLVSFLGIICL